MSKVSYIPIGPKNIKPLFAGVRWDTVTEYFIEVLGQSNQVLATLPTQRICNCSPDGVRIHFLNFNGVFEAIDFQKPQIVHDDTASEFQSPLSNPLNKTDSGIERFNIRGIDTYEAIRKSTEQDMFWLQQCADSPKWLMEIPSIEGQPEAYIPLVKISGSYQKQKNLNEYENVFTIRYKLSNEPILIRN